VNVPLLPHASQQRLYARRNLNIAKSTNESNGLVTRAVIQLADGVPAARSTWAWFKVAPLEGGWL
jgi:hypothetical protein